MNPGKCCTLRIENTGELGACSMPTGPQLQNKDTNQSVQKKEKRKQHILALAERIDSGILPLKAR